MEYCQLPTRSFSGLVLISLALIVSAALIGCNGPNAQFAPLKGTVSYNGTPLKHGQVVLVHTSGSMAACEIRSDGSYHIDAPIGENRVMIQCFDRPNLSDVSPKAGLGFGAPKLLIPAKYTDYNSSGLIVTVTDGENLHDWNLVGP
jgi:hypothetical protein